MKLFTKANICVVLLLFFMGLSSAHATHSGNKRKRGSTSVAKAGPGRQTKAMKAATTLLPDSDSEQESLGDLESSGELEKEETISSQHEEEESPFEIKIGTSSSMKKFQERFTDACSEKRSFRRFCQLAGADLVKILVSVGATSLSAYCSESWMPSDATSKAIATTAIVTAMSGKVGEAVTKIIEAVENCKVPSGASINEIYQEIVDESREIVAKSPVRFQIELVDAKIRAMLKGADKDKDSKLELDQVLRLVSERIALVSIPYELKDIAQIGKGSDPELKKHYDAIVHELVLKRPESERDLMEVFLQEIRDLSIGSRGGHIQALFYGPPGTGKTTFAQEVGERLGINYCVVRTSDYATAEEMLIGATYYRGGANQPTIVTSALFECLSRAKRLPIIIILDEIGTMAFSPEVLEGIRSRTIEVLKTLLDPLKQKGTLVLPPVELDYSRVVFILTSNFKQTNLALGDRLPTFEFDAIGMDGYNSAFNDAVKSARMDLLDKDLKKEDIDSILGIVKILNGFVIENYAPEFPGGRVIKKVVKNLSIQVRNLYFRQKTDFEAKEFMKANRKDLEEFIQKTIRSFKVKDAKDAKETKDAGPSTTGV